ncbi:hypothetical protein WEN_00925 [Mycoplasma wenyonii str. Massachusetts]|uniref:Uncharacterized protein n=1 Tax=Mycoplasma wenyonii (strain Massachusetts) TaxID=1197325 RepID=I6YAK8_MYCWM|nr:hypothetical protein [Mycoplasma wenyonii]AFN64986.1 hypothetical protein WEN_00925 [Mycoplasma wenyonii str. Massachusetts]
MLALKLLFIPIGGSIVALSGASSLSSIDWDPKDLWRITKNNKFYLSSCFNNPYGNRIKWTYSDFSIYLIRKSSEGAIEENTQLELWGEGHYKKINNGVVTETQNYKKNLHSTLSGDGGQTTDYRIRKFPSGKVQLGETGGGTDSERFGEDIDCKNNVFDISGDITSTSTELDLNKVTFTLKTDRNNNTYKGYTVFSIEIEDSNRGSQKVTWAKNFNPIVIVPS